MTPFIASLISAAAPCAILIFYSQFSGKKAFFASIATAIAGIGIIGILPISENKWIFLALIAAAVSGTFLFLWIFRKTQAKRLDPWQKELAETESQDALEEKRKKELKAEIDGLERETVRTVKVYGAVKGLGEALSWEEMVPHIDYAVQQCMGFKDYQLFLLDETSKLQKVLSRGGSRIIDPPIESCSPLACFHQKSNDSYIENPIRHGDTQIGLLWAKVPPTEPLPPRESLLTETAEISEELVMGLQKARLFSSLEKLSRIDGLTGVHRRQIFNDRLNEEIRRARVFRTPFSILIADVDHFKRVNDTYGHQAGDEVLKRLGELLRKNVYETDFVARYGGEEFVILFPQADPQGVIRKAEMLRARIAEEAFTLGWNKLQVTMSFGIAHFPVDAMDGAALLETADRALYMAKDSGRNRVVDSSYLRQS